MGRLTLLAILSPPSFSIAQLSGFGSPNHFAADNSQPGIWDVTLILGGVGAASSLLATSAERVLASESNLIWPDRLAAALATGGCVAAAFQLDTWHCRCSAASTLSLAIPQ